MDNCLYHADDRVHDLLGDFYALCFDLWRDQSTTAHKLRDAFSDHLTTLGVSKDQQWAIVHRAHEAALNWACEQEMKQYTEQN